MTTKADRALAGNHSRAPVDPKFSIDRTRSSIHEVSPRSFSNSSRDRFRFEAVIYSRGSAAILLEFESRSILSTGRKAPEYADPCRKRVPRMEGGTILTSSIVSHQSVQINGGLKIRKDRPA